MRKLLLGVLLGGFLTLIGVQAAHSHTATSGSEPCAVCAIGQQTSRLAPSAAPTVVGALLAFEVPPFAASPVVAGAALDSRSRAPPAAH